MNTNEMNHADLLRFVGSFSLGALVYIAFFVIIDMRGFDAVLDTLSGGGVVIFMIVVLGAPVAAYVHVSGTEPARFLGLAALGATSAFVVGAFMPSDQAGDSAILPVIYLFILAILAGGTVVHLIIDRSEADRRSLQVIGGLLYGAVGLLAYLFIAGEIFFRFDSVSATLATVVMATIFVGVTAGYLYVTYTPAPPFLGLALLGAFLAVALLGPQPMAQPEIVVPFFAAIVVGTGVFVMYRRRRVETGVG